MSGEKQNPQIPSFGEILISILEQGRTRATSDLNNFKVGDKVVLADKDVVTYLVPVTTKETIGKNMERHNKGLSKYFTEVEGVVTHIEQSFIYKCGHCSNEHIHDLIVYYKELGQSFYTSSDEVIILELDK
jgi:hypothetical protein